MSTEGIFVVVLTVQKGTGRLLSSPDIISRGFIYLRDSEELINSIRAYAKQKVSRVYSGRHVDFESFKRDLRDEITQILYDQTRRTPIVIPVINEIGSNNSPAARQRQNELDQRDRNFEQQEIARIRGQNSAHFAPRQQNNRAPQSQNRAARPTSTNSDSPRPMSRPVVKKSPNDISFKKNTTGPNPMRMWRES